jgi:hypothetical protein
MPVPHLLQHHCLAPRSATMNGSLPAMVTGSERTEYHDETHFEMVAFFFFDGEPRIKNMALGRDVLERPVID